MEEIERAASKPYKAGFNWFTSALVLLFLNRIDAVKLLSAIRTVLNKVTENATTLYSLNPLTSINSSSWNLRDKFTKSNGGCNPVNWLSQTRRNLTIEYLNLNFVTTLKLTPLHSFYAEKAFIPCICLIRLSRMPTRPSLLDTDIFQHILTDSKFSTRSVPVDIPN